jgi:hypothetical protein
MIRVLSEKTEGAIKTGQSRKTGNMWYTRQRKTKQKHSTKCIWTPLYSVSIFFLMQYDKGIVMWCCLDIHLMRNGI